MPDPLTQLAYQTLQQGKNYFGFAHKLLSTQLRNWIAPDSVTSRRTIPPAVLQEYQQRLSQILAVDWQEAEQGVYPTSLLFDHAWQDFLQRYPAVWLDMPLTWERAKTKRHQDFPAEIETESYPSYYLQNFHHQTGGYLTDQSADLYDLQVELLFNGGADVMRRRILAPLKQGLQALNLSRSQPPRVLDVACGTGRTLRMIRAMLPKASLHGIDLSPAYLRKANQLLSGLPGELPQLLQANAEQLPYVDGYFQAVTCVFLFHELPPAVRQHVINECFRVTQPGGTFVICDSIQFSDSPVMADMIEQFPELFHEPYYRHYAQDDLAVRLEQAGFTPIATQVHFLSKYWIAHKPAIAPQAEATAQVYANSTV